MTIDLDGAADPADDRPADRAPGLDPGLDPPSRAAVVLDRMLRDGGSSSSHRRSWRLRQFASAIGVDPQAAPSNAPATPARDARRWRHGRALWVSVAAAAAVVATVVVVPFGRPPPLEDRLPVADPAVGAGEPSVAGDEAGAEAATGAAAASPEERSGEMGDDADAAAGGPVVVHVAGAVTSPGVVTLEPGSRVVDAVTAAGGMRPDADPDRVNLAAPLTDGQRVVVPVMGQPVPAEAAPTPASGAPAGGSAGGGAVPAGSPDGVAVAPVDLNSATAEQLDTLPGVGPATAAAIIEHRASAGPFRSIDSLLEVRGIGEAKLEAIRELVTVGG